MARKSFKIRSNLVEALDDTVTSANNNAGELHIEVIPLRKIELDPDNPRDLLLSFKDLNEAIGGTAEEKKRKLDEKNDLSSMVKSIVEQGVINPVVVYKFGDVYRLIAGERRTLASVIANKTDIPAKVLTTKPGKLKLSLIQWIENIEREDLSLWERLRNLEKIINAYAENKSESMSNITAQEITDLLGCSIQQANCYRNIINSSNELRNHIQLGNITSIDKAAFISKSPKEIQATLIQACIDGNTLSEMRKMAKPQNKDKVTSSAGRPTSKIHLGSTSLTNVAKIILESVIKNKSLEKYTSSLSDIVWDDPKSISAAFKQLINSLEKA